MARSTYIYVVHETIDRVREVVGVFTVKHELVTWLKRQRPGVTATLYVRRMSDGNHATPVWMNMMELLS